MTSSGRGSRRRAVAAKAARIRASSPGWVLAATITGRPPRARPSRSASPESTGRSGAANLASARPSTSAPRDRSAAAAVWSRARIRSKEPKRARAAPGASPQRLTLAGERRADTRAMRAPRLLVAAMRFGQRSLSTKTAKSGRQWRTKRRAAAGVSIGAYWCITPAGKRWARISAAARVPLVTSTLASRSSFRRRARGARERLSPTLAPCNHASRPTGRSRLGYPSRSPSRSGSSFPDRTRRLSRAAANGEIAPEAAA